MQKSELQSRVLLGKVQEEPTDDILQVSIISKGTANVFFMGLEITPSNPFFIEPTGTFFSLDFSKIKFTSMIPGESEVLIIYQTLINQTSTCNYPH